MLIKNLKIDSYRMEMTVELQQNSAFREELSEEYIMNEIGKFQMKVIYTPSGTNTQSYNGSYHNNIVWIFGRFVNITKNTSIYLKFTSKALTLNEIRVNADSEWHLLTEKYVSIFAFDICFIVEIYRNYIHKLKNLHDDEQTDFEIRGDDGSVRVHKCMLAAISPVFHKMMAGDWKEIREGCMHLEGMSKTTLQDFKTYIYLNTLPPTVSKTILTIAMRYDIPDMEQICIKNLVLNLKAENIRDLIEFAIIHKYDRLLMAVLESVQYGSIKIKQIRQHVFGDENNVTYIEKENK